MFAESFKYMNFLFFFAENYYKTGNTHKAHAIEQLCYGMGFYPYRHSTMRPNRLYAVNTEKK